VTGFVDATLAEHVGASLTRIFGALIASILIGIPAGIAIGTSRIGQGIPDPVVEFLRLLPPLAYLPLVIIWVGIGEASKITVIAPSPSLHPACWESRSTAWATRRSTSWVDISRMRVGPPPAAGRSSAWR
jgi:ABC-type nitrate/sulfonate/bicarbonate transport system permease component